MINHKDYIDELRYNIEKRDSIKAEVLISHFEEIDEKTKVRVVFELSRADDRFAVPLLERILTERPEVIEAIPALRQVFVTKISDHGAIHILNNKILIHDVNAVFECI